MNSKTTIISFIIGAIIAFLISYVLFDESYDLESITAEEFENYKIDNSNFDFLTYSEALFNAMQAIQKQPDMEELNYFKTYHIIMDGNLQFASTGLNRELRQIGLFVVSPFNRNVGPCPENCDIDAIDAEEFHGPIDIVETEGDGEGGSEAAVAISADDARGLIQIEEQMFQYLVYDEYLRRAMVNISNQNLSEEIAYFRTYSLIMNGAQFFATTALNVNGDQMGDYFVTPFDPHVGPCPDNCD